MANNIDYREIVQTVTANVLKDIKSMQPGIVDDIVKRVQSSLQPTLNSINNQLGSLQQRVAQLEKRSGSLANTTTKTLNQKTKSLNNKKAISPQLGVNTEACKLLLWIQNQPHIVHKGWIIYYDPCDGRLGSGRVYMIRENGTGKTDVSGLFAGAEYSVTKFITVMENGSDWLVKYKWKDPDWDEHIEVAVVHMS